MVKEGVATLVSLGSTSREDRGGGYDSSSVRETVLISGTIVWSLVQTPRVSGIKTLNLLETPTESVFVLVV